MRHTLKSLLPALVMLGFSTVESRADMTLYSNTTTFSGYGIEMGGAALDGATSTSASTTMAADDINVAPGGAGASVTSMTFSVASFNSVSASANVDIRIYGVGADGGVGTILAALNFAPITIPGRTEGLLTYTSTTPIFTVPLSGSFFIGEFFTNDTATATTAQLNNFAIGLFNPPTVGSSADSIFQTSTGGSTNLTSNPTGGFGNFAGNPVANFGFAFSGTAAPSAVPEPTSIILLGLGGICGGMITLRRGKRGAVG